LIVGEVMKVLDSEREEVAAGLYAALLSSLKWIRKEERR